MRFTSMLLPSSWRLRELAMLGLGIFLFYLGRGLVEGQPNTALERSVDIFQLERSIGLSWEHQFQDIAQWSDVLRDYFNLVYIWGHFPLIAAVFVWLLMRHPREYYIFRNALLISAVTGLIIWAVAPTAPPRMLAPFWDTLATNPPVGMVTQPEFLRNQFAAVPSYHAGWALVIECVVWSATRDWRLILLSTLITISMLVSVVATGNHYVLDVLVGSGMAMASFFAALALAGRVPKLGRVGWHVGGK
jgi:membrane-associated phospholipid phosphatase